MLFNSECRAILYILNEGGRCFAGSARNRGVAKEECAPPAGVIVHKCMVPLSSYANCPTVKRWRWIQMVLPTDTVSSLREVFFCTCWDPTAVNRSRELPPFFHLPLTGAGRFCFRLVLASLLSTSRFRKLKLFRYTPAFARDRCR